MQWQVGVATLLSMFGATSPGVADERLRLTGRNTETPFAYVVNGERSWPITLGPPAQTAALELPAFDEIFINTRSHTQLPGSLGDGELGIRPMLDNRKAGANYRHLPIHAPHAYLEASKGP